MRVQYNFSNKKIEGDVEDYSQIILVNKLGGFFNWQEKNDSRYRGLYHKTKNSIFKSIESIRLHDDSKIKLVKNNFWNFEVERENGLKESFFTPYGFNALVYEVNKDVRFDVVLDAKAMFDNDEWGRNYSFSEDKGKIIIEYSKYKGEDKKYSFFMVLAGKDLKFKQKKDWVLKDYSYDFKRRDPPFGRYIFSALEVFGSGFVFTVSPDKQTAIRNSNEILNSLEDLKGHHKKNIDNFYTKNNKDIPDNEIAMAYLSSRFSISNMIVHKETGGIGGIYAGLPWFSQFWARDALMSLSSVSPKFKKIIFLKYLEEFQGKGKISPCNMECIESFGAAGLFFKRAEDMIADNQLSQEEIASVKSVLVREISRALAEDTKDDFAVNGPKETWMDTDYAGDVREGARIEMQALRLKMYNLAAKLTGQRKYFELEHKLSKKVREFFWTGETLKDGLYDRQARPNIFLAFYIYPDLLFKHEWSKAFSFALEEMYLDWGGLSSISKHSPMFCGKYRGCEDVNQSYHHGDSWYFINNMAAMALRKIDVSKFEKNIEGILSASTKEILWQGALGHHAEVSSADEFSSHGCSAQTWSAALYIEAIDDILKGIK